MPSPHIGIPLALLACELALLFLQNTHSDAFSNGTSCHRHDRRLRGGVRQAEGLPRLGADHGRGVHGAQGPHPEHDGPDEPARGGAGAQQPRSTLFCQPAP